MTKTITKPAIDNNVTRSTARRATKAEVDNAMLILTGMGKAPSEVEISIPEMDTAFDVFCDGITQVNSVTKGLVKALSDQFTASFGVAWYTLEKQGKLGAGVRAYHKKVVDFYKSIGAVNPDQKWAKIKVASGYMTPAMIKDEAQKVEDAGKLKTEENKTRDEKVCGHITSILNLIDKSDIDIKATPYREQFQTLFYSIGSKMVK